MACLDDTQKRVQVCSGKSAFPSVSLSSGGFFLLPLQPTAPIGMRDESATNPDYNGKSKFVPGQTDRRPKLERRGRAAWEEEIWGCENLEDFGKF